MAQKLRSRNRIAQGASKPLLGALASLAASLSLIFPSVNAVAQSNQDPNWPLSKLVGPEAPIDSGQDTDLLNLLDSGKETWKSLFVDRIENPQPDDVLAPYRDQETSNGILGTRAAPYVPGGTWAYMPDANVSISWFFNSNEIFGTHHPCMFEQKGCLRKYISSKADDIDLYNRCTIDPHGQMSKYNFDDKSPLHNSRKPYLKKARQEQRWTQNADKHCNQGKQDVSNSDYEKLMSTQQDLEKYADSLVQKRPEVVQEILSDFANHPPKTDADSCDSINKLLSIGLIDPKAFLANDVESKVLNLLYQNGMVFEFSQHLAMYANAVAKTYGPQALKTDPTIMNLRRMQVELYADYAFQRLGPKATQTAGGMFDKLDVSKDFPGSDKFVLAPGSKKMMTSTLDDELLFLLQAYHNDYPNDPTLIHVGNTRMTTGQFLSQQRQAQMLVKKVDYRSADRHATDQRTWNEAHPKCRNVAYDQRIQCLWDKGYLKY